MKSIVLYYSYGGNTRGVAEKIAAELGADMAEIETVKPYTGSYDRIVEQGQREVSRGFCPELKPIDADLAQYDTVVLGSPVWWYTFCPAMNSFLHGADLSGKEVYPFATNGGWIGHTFKDYAKACPNSNVHAGLNVRFNESERLTPEDEILKWARRIGK